MTNLTILVVDDQPGILKLLRDALELKGYQVFTASNPNFALEIVKEKKPEFLLMDLNLRGQNGLLVAKEIKALFPELKIIFMTAYSEEQLLEPIQEIAEAVLVKPFDLELLYQKLHILKKDRVEQLGILSNCDTRNF
ncbi:response regulator [Carboxydothermus pertinax]|uniref:Stage 0 sporulation protein A homolog n=1 Tax=Carboxydothermus pertinax TaxID=870242 RepID=A0A1L8CVD7_9THEO|nr:response regulator [Carboxydothermus pertinax]GAV22857.1 response regulator [Carboxydothermus pertinax]